MIHVDFNDLDDMMGFVKTLAGMLPEKAAPAMAEAHSQIPVAPSPAPSLASPVQDWAPAGTPPVQGPAQAAAPSGQPKPVPTASAAPSPAPSAVPTSSIAYALDDLARAAGTLMDTGRQAELVSLLQQFGVASLPELPQAHYWAFATALRGLGAQI